MTVTLDWLGVSTFRLIVDDVIIFLDAYLDRVPSAPPVGLTTADVDRADFILVGHSHFDHLWGAERIANRTGATIIGSHETARIMTNEELPESQLVTVSGGERVRLSDKVTVRVFPSQHSCIWAKSGAPDEVCLGDQGLTLQERESNLNWSNRRWGEQPGGGEMLKHMDKSSQHPRGDGSALAYLIETPEGSILWKDTSGHWTGIMRDIRPDVALLAAAGRGNVDGDPVQGALGHFLAREADLLRPRSIVLCHHDNWMPPFTQPHDMEPVVHEISRQVPYTEVIEMGYLEEYPVLERR